MRSVQLHTVKTGFLTALCRSNKIVDQRLYLIITHRFRAGFFIVRWALRHPRAVVGLSTHTAVLQLHHRMTVMSLNTVSQAGKARNMPVVVSTQLSREIRPLSVAPKRHRSW